MGQEQARMEAMPMSGAAVQSAGRATTKLIMLGSAVYALPLDLATEEKFRALASAYDVYVVAQSGKILPKWFRQHARFYLIPRLPVPGAGFVALQLLSPLILVWLIFRHGIDSVLAQSPHEGFSAALVKKFCALCGRSVAFVLESHGDFQKAQGLVRRLPFQSFFDRLRDGMARLGVAGADSYRAVSLTTARQLQDFGAHSPPHIYPAWMQLGVFERAGRDNEAMPRGNYILFAGDISYLKGVDVLLRAFALLAREDDEALLVLAGPTVNSVFMSQMKTFCSEAGIASRAQFVGKKGIQELASLMANAKVLVLPSRSEAYGRVLVESLAAGTPVICSNVGGMVEIAQDPSYSSIVLGEDEEALCTAMTKWLRASDGGGVRYRCRQRAADLFSPEAYLAVLGQCLREAHSSMSRETRKCV